MNLTDRALLVHLNVSQWTARKYDKRASKEVTTAHGAASAAGRFNKSLLPMNDKLENIHRKTTLIRTKYYESTLPWGIDGTRMLPTANYLSFMSDFRKEKGEWEQLVQEFLDEYDQMKLDAQRTPWLPVRPGGLSKRTRTTAQVQDGHGRVPCAQCGLPCRHRLRGTDTHPAGC